MMDLDRGRIEKIEFLEFHGDLTIEGSNTNRIIIERLRYNEVPAAVKEPLESMGYKKGDLDIQPLITQRITLEQAPEIISEMARGGSPDNVKTVIRFDS